MGKSPLTAQVDMHRPLRPASLSSGEDDAAMDFPPVLSVCVYVCVPEGNT